MTKKYDQAFLTAWRIFKNKRPVNRPTSQIAAQQAYNKIEHHLTDEEQTNLSIGWGHATGCSGESRREFDSVCKEIEKRLFPKHERDTVKVKKPRAVKSR